MRLPVDDQIEVAYEIYQWITGMWDIPAIPINRIG